MRAPTAGSYYWFFHTARGFTTVDHFERKPGVPRPQRVLYLETNRDQRLDRTVKCDEILRGQYGTVCVERTCFFNRVVVNNPNYISTLVLSNTDESGAEIPGELPGKPDEQIPPLTSLSLTRIFRDESEYVVVSANYESTGEIGSLTTARTRVGEIIPGSASTVLRQALTDSSLERYGIPRRIDVQEYLRSNRLPLPSAALPQELAAVTQQYGFGKLIRQDQLRKDTAVLSRFLRPSVTKEEQTLNPECDARFVQQRSLGLNTVQ